MANIYENGGASTFSTLSTSSSATIGGTTKFNNDAGNAGVARLALGVSGVTISNNTTYSFFAGTSGSFIFLNDSNNGWWFLAAVTSTNTVTIIAQHSVNAFVTSVTSGKYSLSYVSSTGILSIFNNATVSGLTASIFSMGY